MSSPSGLFFIHFRRTQLVALAALVLAWIPFIAAAQYVGAETCSGSTCHSGLGGEQYKQWITSGHRFILMESASARHRSLPLPDGVARWDEISYVIGGHSKKVMYLDDEGNIIDQQFNLLTGEFSDYDGSSTYDCGECHTTGYDAAGAAPLPGMVGSFELAGVQCEHCHNAGIHPSDNDAPTDAAFCGECHNHGDTTMVAASGGYIVAEGQYNELLASPHDSANCVTCHNPHEGAEVDVTSVCGNCHSSKVAGYASTLMAQVGVECDDCHMSPAGLSGQAPGPNQGDTKTHLFRINTDPAANMFTADGSQVALEDGEGAVTLNFACQRCHAGTSLETLSKFAKDFHDASPSERLAYVGLNAGLSGTWWGGFDRDGEGFLMEFAYIGDTLIFFGSFYTFDPAGNQAWLTFQPVGGVPTSGTSMDVEVFITTGPMWGDDFDPADKNTQPFGTGNFTFDTCTAGSVNIEPNQTYLDLGYSSLVYESLTRILEPGVDCPSFDNSSEAAAQAAR
jgi:hypothetical protein